MLRQTFIFFFTLTGSDGQLCYRVLKKVVKSESCPFLTSPEISRKIWPWLNEWKPWNKSLRLKSWSAACNSLSDHDQFHCAICIPSSKKLFSRAQSPFCKVAASSDMKILTCMTTNSRVRLSWIRRHN